MASLASDQMAALKGASLAFQKQQTGSRSTQPSQQGVATHSTPNTRVGADTLSASFIAANLAASRSPSPSPSPRPVGPVTPSPGLRGRPHSRASSVVSLRLESPLGRTTGAEGNRSHRSQRSTATIVPDESLLPSAQRPSDGRRGDPVKSPSPRRPNVVPSPPRIPSDDAMDEASPGEAPRITSRQKTRTMKMPKLKEPAALTGSSEDEGTTVPRRCSLNKEVKPVPKPKPQQYIAKDQALETLQHVNFPEPDRPKLRPQERVARVSPSPPPRSPTTSRPTATPTPPRPRAQKRVVRDDNGGRFSNSSSNLALDSLTNAIVAGSLASARHSPAAGLGRSKTPPPIPAPRSHGHERLLTHHSGSSISHRNGTPTPRKQGMLQTLRAPPSSSDDQDLRRNKEFRRRHGLLSKNHAYHEGSRRKWRDQVNPEERRRYEALWASQSQLLWATSDDPDEKVLANVVVRDIWRRSMLPFDELAEVWELVNQRRSKHLSKEQFVVGTWLIDMRLRGHKLPIRVSQSIWDSVRDLRVLAPSGRGQRHK